ncbi:MAG: nitronate monooxygenase [Pseudomonadota bacterium]
MIKTRLSKRLGLKHPVIQAPMAMAAGGKLASAVSQAGGLGMIGGAYCDPEWIESQFEVAGNSDIGCGFITWALAKNPALLTRTLERKPKAIFLSFADPEPFVKEIKAAGSLFICQVQSLKHAEHAVDCGADIIVAQGTEAGGHGAVRSTTVLVPEIADMLVKKSPATLLCAAGGIGDGRGLAASLMLGADGAVVGSRFWASHEALVHQGILNASLAATGDETIRTNVVDIIRKLDWPSGYSCRVLNNTFTKNWHDDHTGLRKNLEAEIENWTQALGKGDADNASAIVGEATGLFNDIKPAADLLEDMISHAEKLLRQAPELVLT